MHSTSIRRNLSGVHGQRLSTCRIQYVSQIWERTILLIQTVTYLFGICSHRKSWLLQRFASELIQGLFQFCCHEASYTPWILDDLSSYPSQNQQILPPKFNMDTQVTWKFGSTAGLLFQIWAIFFGVSGIQPFDFKGCTVLPNEKSLEVGGWNSRPIWVPVASWSLWRWPPKRIWMSGDPGFWVMGNGLGDGFFPS